MNSWRKGLNLKRDLQAELSTVTTGTLSPFTRMKELNPQTTLDGVLTVSNQPSVPPPKNGALTSEIISESCVERDECSQPLERFGQVGTKMGGGIISRFFEDLKPLVSGSLECSSRTERLNRVLWVWIGGAGVCSQLY